MELPKRWYTIKQVAERWKKKGIDCCEDDVLHYIHRLILHPSFYLETTVCRVNGQEDIRVGLYTPHFPIILFCSRRLKDGWKDELTARFLYSGPPILDASKTDFKSIETIYPLEPVPITIDDFIITSEELERFENENGIISSSKEPKATDTPTRLEDPQQGSNYPTGGAPEATITTAVKWAYSRLKDTGNTELIKAGKLKGFFQYLKESVTEGNTNYSEYLAERIKEVKNVGGDCQIIIHPLSPKEKEKFQKTGKNIVIKKPRISSILSEIRNPKLP